MKRKTFNLRLVYLCLLYLLIPLPDLGAESLDSLMKRAGLVDVQSLDSTIRVDLKYSTTGNFIGANMYGSLRRAYLEKGFAERLLKAQRELQRRHPAYRLIIYDAARPMSVQRRMRSAVEGTKLSIYVAPAERGGRHNYGVAVDLSIIDAKGKALDMGSPFDYFGKESHLGQEESLLQEGLITREAIRNRRLLREVMDVAGFRPYDKEWWHYQERIPMTEVRKRYKRLDF